MLDVFISFHYDSTEDSNEASGTTTYYYDEKNLPLANAVENELAKNLPLISRGVEFGDYQVLRENNQPALLLELGYMNNDNDLAQFKTKNTKNLLLKPFKMLYSSTSNKRSLYQEAQMFELLDN